MDERGVNIDIVFRNGLKDYEVLPPADVWDDIRPEIQKRQRPYIIFRAAALLAVAVSLSFLVYRWSNEFSTIRQELLQAQDNSPVIPAPPSEVTEHQAEKRISGQVFLADASQPVLKPDVNETKRTGLFVQSVESPPVSDAMPAIADTEKSDSELQISNEPVINSNERNIYTPDLIPENVAQEKSGRWTIAALVSPSYHSRLTSGNNETMASLMTSEKPIISYSGGVALSYRITKRFSVQSGLYYSDIGQDLSGISAYSGFLSHNNSKGASNFDVITANGTVKTSNNDVFLLDDYKGNRVITPYTSNVFDPAKAELNYIGSSLRQDFRYLEVPVMVRYKVVDKTLDFNIIGGLSSNLLVSNTVSAGTGSKYLIGETEELNSVTFSSSLGMGMEYNFSNKLSLNFEPTFRYYLNPFGSITGIKIHPFSFGVFSGLSYRF